MLKLRHYLRLLVISIFHIYLRKIFKMDISPSARISFGTKLDKTFPKGIHIGSESYLASGSIMFSHDFTRSIKEHTYIGEKCFIGANAIIMAGVKIGDEVIIGSGSIVTRDIPSNSIAVGNPAKVIKSNIETVKFGQLKGAKTTIERNAK